MTPETILAAFAEQCAEQGEILIAADDLSAVFIEGRFDLVKVCERLSEPQTEEG